MEQYRIDFESMQWEQAAAGVRTKVFERNSRRLRLAQFTKDFVEKDWCSKGHIGYVLDGQVEIHFDGRKIVFGPGDALFILQGPEHRHKARVLTESATLFLVENV